MSVYNRDRLRCHLCGCLTDGEPFSDTAPTLDHIVPYTNVGKISSDPSKIVVACRKCNSVRGDRQLTPSELEHATSLAMQPLDRKVGRQLLRDNPKWPQALAKLTARYQGIGSTIATPNGGGHFPR